MKLTKLIGLTALLLGASAGLAAAQSDSGPGPGPGGPPGGRGHRPPPLPIMISLDTNHDGVLDANEIANASAALLTQDKNGDGKLTREEYMPAPPNGKAPPAGQNGNRRQHPMPPIVAALDANHDGVIDADEIANASAALKTMDKNGDGKLTQEELRPAHQGPPPGGDFDGPPPMDDAPPGPPPGNE